MEKSKTLKRQFHIFLYGSEIDEVVTVGTNNFDNLGNDKDAFSLWEVDNILSSCWSTGDFLDIINQFIPFTPTRIGMGTMKIKNRAVIMNDNTIKDITDYLIKKKTASAKDAKISDYEAGNKAIGNLVKEYDDMINKKNKRKIWAAMYKVRAEEMETYHLDAILRCSENLRKECNVELSNYTNANRESRLYYALDNYNEFRDAYIFMKHFKNDYSLIENAVKDDTIINAKIKFNAERTGYSYELVTVNHGNMIVSSNRRIIKNSDKELEDLYDLDEEDIKTMYSNEEVIDYSNPDYSIPDEEYEKNGGAIYQMK